MLRRSGWLEQQAGGQPCRWLQDRGRQLLHAPVPSPTQRFACHCEQRRVEQGRPGRCGGASSSQLAALWQQPGLTAAPRAVPCNEWGCAALAFQGQLPAASPGEAALLGCVWCGLCMRLAVLWGPKRYDMFSNPDGKCSTQLLAAAGSWQCCAPAAAANGVGSVQGLHP